MRKYKNLPANGGPAVIGIAISPNKKPIPWAAPAGPNRSKAMGPRRQTKQPSQKPITMVITIKAGKDLAKGIQAVVTPNTMKAICCILIRLTPWKSDNFPNIRRPTPDEAPIDVTSRPPLASGRISLVCFTC